MEACAVLRGHKPFGLVGELVAGGSGGTQPLTFPGAAAGAIVVMVVVHLHVATVAAVVGAADAARELGLLIPLDDFLDDDLFHSDFPFLAVYFYKQFLAGNTRCVL